MPHETASKPQNTLPLGVQRTNSQPVSDEASAFSPSLPFAGGRSAASRLISLQRTIGNQAVQRMLRGESASSSRVLQREVIDMPALTVIGDRGGTLENNVSHLDSLRQPPSADGVTMAHDEAHIDLNSPTPTDPLPFTATGWDSDTILNQLGQYDTLAGTDSDSTRCVQAVAMASRIPQGPDAVVSYLNTMMLQGMLERPNTQREQTAHRVLEVVVGRLESRRATYAELSWAQEALHDLFFTDTEGTPESQVDSQINPSLDLSGRNVTTENIWCNSAADLIAAANTLPPGGQLIINFWQVIFNTAYDQVEEQGFETRDRMRVEINGRMQWIRRIATDTRPNPTQIDAFSDTRTGHQLLILRDNVPNGPLKLYEPETTVSGQHLIPLTASGSELASYFRDNPDIGMYGYVQVRGRVIPPSASAASSVYNPTEL
jgi:hypothetical protein